jgi:hypothetical protein
MRSDDTRELQGYAPGTLDEIQTLLERAGGRQIDAAALEEDLLAVVHAIGLAHDGSDEGKLWLGLAADDPSHAEMAEGFARAADAENPVDPAVLGKNLRAGLSARIRSRWKARWGREHRNLEPSLSSIDWDFLNDAERGEIRGMLRDLAAYHRSFVRRGRVQKDKLDTALHELARIYLDNTGLQNAEQELPYSIKSRFIRFCVLALEPVGQYFEVSPQALSRRWERLVNAMRGALPDEAPEDD